MDVFVDNESSDEEVVEELDVFLSKSLNNHLYLLQYPVLASGWKFGAGGREFANIKPHNNKIEMDVSLDISSPNYDQGKGEQIALNVDGISDISQASAVFEANVMDKQKLCSSCVPPRGKRYVCGIIRGRNLHLSPISKVMQLRPSFKYMDRAERRVLQAAKSKAAAEVDTSQDEIEEAKAVTLRIKGVETEAARLARERSYEVYEKRLADEKWICTKVHHKEDPFAEKEQQRLIFRQTRQYDEEIDKERNFNEIVQSPFRYLNMLAPIYDGHTLDNSAEPSIALSLSMLKNESLGEQIRLLMMSAKIIHFSHLLSILPNCPDQNTIVRSLQSYAVLVKGCWLVKSELIFLPKTQSPVSGTSSELLCRTRDYILVRYTIDEYQVRKKITSTMKVPGDEIKAILEDIAVMHKGHGWRLKLMPDYDFMKKFPDVCDRQAMLWKAQGAKLAKLLNLPDILKEAIGGTVNQGNATLTRWPKASSADQKLNTKTGPKLSRKRRETSGTKAWPSSVKSNVILSMNHMKSEPMSPSATASLPALSLMPPARTPDEQTENIASECYAQPLGPFVADIHLSNAQSMLPKINIAGVNSTVQSVANEIRKIGSPSNGVSYFMSQVDTAAPEMAAGLVEQGSEQRFSDN